jgi:hypothetical protein
MQPHFTSDLIWKTVNQSPPRKKERVTLQKNRNMIVLMLVLGICLMAPASHAAVEFVGVFKSQFHKQTSAVDVTPQDPGFPPFEFEASVSGSDIGGIAAPTVSGPMNNGEPSHNAGVLGLNGDGDWGYGSPDFSGVGADTKADLDTVFPNGVYTISVLGQNVALNVTGDTYASAPPLMTLTGGAWQGDVYVIDPDQELTITTSTFTEYGTTNTVEAIFLDIFGPGIDDGITQLSSETASQFVTITVPANSLSPGQLYWVESGFIMTSDAQSGIPGLPVDALGVAGYEQVTEVLVQVTPEPTSLALLGMGGLALFRRHHN